jgi:hypothetical protein
MHKIAMKFLGMQTKLGWDSNWRKIYLAKKIGRWKEVDFTGERLNLTVPIWCTIKNILVQNKISISESSSGS